MESKLQFVGSFLTTDFTDDTDKVLVQHPVFSIRVIRAISGSITLTPQAA
jgi:hypothetical protein